MNGTMRRNRGGGGGGQAVLILREHTVGSLSEVVEAGLRRVVPPANREEVIIENVDEDTGVAPVGRGHTLLAANDNRVGVGEAVDSLVHSNPGTDGLRVSPDIDALDEVPHQIADDRLGSATREKEMCQEVHRAKAVSGPVTSQCLPVTLGSRETGGQLCSAFGGTFAR